jgi:curved DNA-binding protein CbpA
MTITDYYTLLSVPPDATLAAIKRAYRKLARQHHPDVNGGDPDAAARFKLIIEAYEVLSGPAQRMKYDRSYQPPAGTQVAAPGNDTEAVTGSCTCWKTSGRPSVPTIRRSPWW